MSFYPSKERVRIATQNEEPTRTKQEFREDADIHSIIAKYTRSGVLEWAQKNEPRYGEFDGAMDYIDALQRVEEAHEQFMELPAAIRERFDNDPAELLEFLEHDSNRPEAEELGLVAPAAGSSAPEPPEAVPPEAPSSPEENAPDGARSEATPAPPSTP